MGTEGQGCAVKGGPPAGEIKEIEGDRGGGGEFQLETMGLNGGQFGGAGGLRREGLVIDAINGAAGQVIGHQS